MQRHSVVVRHWSDVDWRRYRQEYINECSNYLSDPPRSNHPVIMLTNGRSHVIFVIWFVSLCVRVSVVLYSPGGDCGAVTMLVGTRSRRRSSSRTEYVAVLMVRVRARRWSRLLDWMWIGRRRHSQLTWRIDRLERCVSVEDRMKYDGSPAWSHAFIGIPCGHVLVTRYIRINLQSPVIMCFSSCIYHLHCYYISGTCISGGETLSGKSSWRSGKFSGTYFYLSGWPFQGLESPYLSLHRLLDMQAARGGSIEPGWLMR